MADFQFLISSALDKIKSKSNINTDIKYLQNDVDKLNIQAELSPNALKNLTTQIQSAIGQKVTINGININPSQAQNEGQQIGKQIANGVNSGIGANTSKLEQFRKSLSSIGMDSTDIDNVAKRIENLGVKINSLNQSAAYSKGKKSDKNILSVDIDGIDKFGQAIKLTQQYDIANGNLVKSIDSVSSATKKVSDNSIKKVSDTIDALKVKLTNADTKVKLIDAKYTNNEIANIEQTVAQLKTDITNAMSETDINKVNQAFSKIDQTIKLLSNDVTSYEKKQSTITEQNNALQKQAELLAKMQTLKTQNAGLFDDNGSNYNANVVTQYNEVLQKINGINNASSSNVAKSSFDGLAASIKNTNAELDTSKNSVRVLSQTDVTLKTEKATQRISALKIETQKLNASVDFSKLDDALNVAAIDRTSEAFKKVEIEITKVKTALNGVKSNDKTMNIASQNQLSSTIVSLNEQLRKNGKYSSEAKEKIKGFISECSKGNVAASRLADIKIEAKQLHSSMANLNKTGKSFGEGIKDQAGKFTQWISVSAMVMRGVHAFKQMVSNVKELDDTLTNINYTMDVTTSDLEKIGSKSLETAKNLKTSASNVLNAVKLYANANETVDKILEKAQTSVMLSNVTGISTTDTSKTLQAIMNQFDLDINSVQHVSDVLQGVSSGMAWDFSDGIVQISDAIKMSGSVAKQAGLELEDYSALIGKLVESTGLSGSTIGTAMRTMMTRITKASASGESSEDDISKAETALRNVGVEVRSDVDTFRDMNDILGDLAAKWDTLTDVQKNAISYQAAGTRQTSIFSTLMKDYQGYLDLADKANNSEDLTLENQEKYASSLSGKLGELSAIWASIGNNALSSNLLKGITDAGVGVSSLIEKFGLLKTILVGIGAGIAFKNVGRDDYQCSRNFYTPTHIRRLSQWIWRLLFLCKCTCIVCDNVSNTWILA